jgi:hypothetical protein
MDDSERGAAAMDETKMAVMMSRRMTGEKVVFITSSFNLEDLSYIIHYRENQ